MATVRLDVHSEAVLKRLAARRGQTKSEVLRDAIAYLAEKEREPLTAYHRLQPFLGLADSGGQQLSTGTGRQLRHLLEERRRARLPR
jgi:Arc/MetJ-type ribon-helix-helix transcriptional regulator